LLALVVDRGERCTLKLWMSEDDGASWSERLVVYDHAKPDAVSQGKTNIDFVEYWGDMSKWTFGHPAIHSLGNGRILLAYYAGVTKCLRIHWFGSRSTRRRPGPAPSRPCPRPITPSFQRPGF